MKKLHSPLEILQLVQFTLKKVESQPFYNILKNSNKNFSLLGGYLEPGTSK